MSNVGERSPVAILNELRIGLKYELLEQTGPSHAPIFKVCVEVDGQKYHGEGNSKKTARCKAAEAALKSFIQFPNSCKIVPSTMHSNQNLDFTSDNFEAKATSPLIIDANKTAENQKRNASMILNTLYPNAQYVCTENDDIYARFMVTVNINGDTFFGTG